MRSSDLPHFIFQVPLGIWRTDFYYARRHMVSDSTYWLLSSFGIFLTTVAITITLLIANASFVAALRTVEDTGLYFFTIRVRDVSPSLAYQRAELVAGELARVLGDRGEALPAYLVDDANVQSLAGEMKVSLLAIPLKEMFANYFQTDGNVLRFIATGTATCLVPQSFPISPDSSRRSMMLIQRRFACEAFAYAKAQPRLSALFRNSDIVVAPLESLVASSWFREDIGRARDLSVVILLNGNRSFGEVSQIFNEVQLAIKKFSLSAKWEGVKLGEASQTIDQLLGIVLLVGGLAWIVSAAGISSSTLLSIRQRTNEIGIRLAVGASPRNLWNQFIFEAAIVVLLGLLAGWLVATPIGMVYAHYKNLPLILHPAPYLITFFGASVVVLLAVVIPLRKISRLDPAGVIRSVK